MPSNNQIQTTVPFHDLVHPQAWAIMVRARVRAPHRICLCKVTYDWTAQYMNFYRCCSMQVSAARLSTLPAALM